MFISDALAPRPSRPTTSMPGMNGETALEPGGSSVLKIGLKTAPIRVAWVDLEAVWGLAGALDCFDSMWLYDHFYPNDGDGSCFEGFVALASLARLVPRSTVGHLVLASPYRHPALVAKMASTLDHATGGRLILGLGAGWHVPETEAYGMDLAPIGERLASLRAAIEVIRGLFRPEAGAWPPAGGPGSRAFGGISLDAPPFRLRHARNDPLPIQGNALPIWLGVQGERVGLRLAAELADGWNFSGVGDVEDFRRKRAILLEAADGFGREPGSIEISAQLRVDPSDAAAALDRCASFVEAGCQHVILYLDPRTGPASVEALLRFVVEPLRAQFSR
jgi:alkanesulfonate monooxygenase SsuD/methylene tetrahydromethanopterin reductase-like flavin-dependent oxidoreductase (luciferase family)